MSEEAPQRQRQVWIGAPPDAYPVTERAEVEECRRALGQRDSWARIWDELAVYTPE